MTSSRGRRAEISAAVRGGRQLWPRWGTRENEVGTWACAGERRGRECSMVGQVVLSMGVLNIGISCINIKQQ